MANETRQGERAEVSANPALTMSQTAAVGHVEGSLTTIFAASRWVRGNIDLLPSLTKLLSTSAIPILSSTGNSGRLGPPLERRETELSFPRSWEKWRGIWCPSSAFCRLVRTKMHTKAVDIAANAAVHTSVTKQTADNGMWLPVRQERKDMIDRHHRVPYMRGRKHGRTVEGSGEIRDLRRHQGVFA